jgi:dolichol-phosphate mannosyltransferase
MPLQIATYLGFIVSLMSFAYLAYAIYLKLYTDQVVQGWASVIVAVLFVGGVQLISLGVIGEYIGRIYEEVKQRPLYLVQAVSGFDKVPAADNGVSAQPTSAQGPSRLESTALRTRPISR